MRFVYILACADGTLYTGSTTDIERRIREHNGAKAGARYTKTRRPVMLRYVEKYKTVGAALRREAAIKKLTRSEKLTLIAQNHDLSKTRLRKTA